MDSSQRSDDNHRIWSLGFGASAGTALTGAATVVGNGPASTLLILLAPFVTSLVTLFWQNKVIPHFDERSYKRSIKSACAEMRKVMADKYATEATKQNAKAQLEYLHTRQTEFAKRKVERNGQKIRFMHETKADDSP
jgi:hypothetical protein